MSAISRTGPGSSLTLRKGVRPPKEGRRRSDGEESPYPSSLQAAVAGSGYPTDKPRRQKPEDEVESLRPEPTGIPLSSARSAPRPEGGVASGRRGEARRRVGGGSSRAPAARFRCAPPRPPSCGLARPRCHVGLCGRRRRRRCGRVGGGVGSLAQSLECEDNDHPALSWPGGSWELPFLSAARRWLAVGACVPRPPPPPRSGGAARCGASDSASPRPCHREG